MMNKNYIRSAAFILAILAIFGLFTCCQVANTDKAVDSTVKESMDACYIVDDTPEEEIADSLEDVALNDLDNSDYMEFEEITEDVLMNNTVILITTPYDDDDDDNSTTINDQNTTSTRKNIEEEEEEEPYVDSDPAFKEEEEEEENIWSLDPDGWHRMLVPADAWYYNLGLVYIKTDYWQYVEYGVDSSIMCVQNEYGEYATITINSANVQDEIELDEYSSNGIEWTVIRANIDYYNAGDVTVTVEVPCTEYSVVDNDAIVFNNEKFNVHVSTEGQAACHIVVVFLDENGEEFARTKFQQFESITYTNGDSIYVFSWEIAYTN